MILPFSNQISSGKELMSHRARAVGCVKETTYASLLASLGTHQKNERSKCCWLQLLSLSSAFCVNKFPSRKTTQTLSPILAAVGIFCVKSWCNWQMRATTPTPQKTTPKSKPRLLSLPLCVIGSCANADSNQEKKHKHQSCCQCHCHKTPCCCPVLSSMV